MYLSFKFFCLKQNVCLTNKKLKYINKKFKIRENKNITNNEYNDLNAAILHSKKKS